MKTPARKQADFGRVRSSVKSGKNVCDLLGLTGGQRGSITLVEEAFQFLVFEALDHERL